MLLEEYEARRGLEKVGPRSNDRVQPKSVNLSGFDDV